MDVSNNFSAFAVAIDLIIGTLLDWLCLWRSLDSCILVSATLGEITRFVMISKIEMIQERQVTYLTL